MKLLEIIAEIEAAGATIINGTELKDYERIVSPDGWNWDYGSTRGYPNVCLFGVVRHGSGTHDSLAILEKQC